MGGSPFAKFYGGPATVTLLTHTYIQLCFLPGVGGVIRIPLTLSITMCP